MTEEQFNPFSPEQAPGVQVVILMRIYDALMALLQVTDKDTHDALDKLHESGQLAWSLPTLNISADETESQSAGESQTASESEDNDFVPPPSADNAYDRQYRLGD